MEETGNVVEVFSSVQGEGVHIGRRHIFVRFAGCGFGCGYCDQPEALEPVPEARIEVAAGSGEFEVLPNPVSADDLAHAVLRLNSQPGLHHAIALTGGEPLEQVEFIQGFLPLIARAGPRIMLETNGVHVDALERILHLLDIVSMDFKLSSATGRPTPRGEHARFLAVAAAKEVYVKVVVAPRTTAEEVADAAMCVGQVDRAIPFVIQPVTAPERPSAGDLLSIQAVASNLLSDVRVIGQMHPTLGMR